MRCLVMGILNVTPDSFFDGGRYVDPKAAIARGMALVDEGADIIDVGGESTRPGADPVEVSEELSRVLPVIEALSCKARVSIDTMKSEVARAAVGAGASLINDVTATLAPVAGELGVGLVAMHMAGSPKTMQLDPHYDDVVEEVFSYLGRAADLARSLGVNELYLDPGIGFGKTAEHNLALLRALPRLIAMGTPVLLGTSRKSLVGAISASLGSRSLGLEDRLEGSLATAVYAMTTGVAAVRVHDVAPTAMAARMLERVPAPNERVVERVR